MRSHSDRSRPPVRGLWNVISLDCAASWVVFVRRGKSRATRRMSACGRVDEGRVGWFDADAKGHFRLDRKWKVTSIEHPQEL
jgi:hypothetical protein